jgi:hypothetical protein
VNHFKKHNQDMIQDVFQELKEEGHILKQYSQSGWWIFHRRDIMQKMYEKVKEKHNLDRSYLRLHLFELLTNGTLPYEPSIIHKIDTFFDQTREY